MSAISYGILSTYPPTQCGLATFTAALADSLADTETSSRSSSPVGIVSIVDFPHEAPADPNVTHRWVRGAPRAGIHAATALNRFDVAIIQHEYGIFGGRDGGDVLEVVHALTVPAIVVMHTVLTNPTTHQRAILQALAHMSAVVVTMTQTARRRLVDLYSVDAAKIRVIPHGADDNRRPLKYEAGDPLTRTPLILTWGLLGPGKGIEWAIDAMGHIADLRPAPQYRIVGQTHPRVLERQGEDYRASLANRARLLGVTKSVHFDARYLGRSELSRMVRQADVVLLPYDARDQVTSGVLIEAIAAGKPVIATGFPHARELLSSGAGIIVERQDSNSIAAALRRLFTEPGLAVDMEAEARRIAPDLLWPAVGRQYRAIGEDLLRADSTLATA
ncbi:glycosyltransferase [Smaragdicoccus niigatensis]|uniref:glycosyltransferase n=1 Tax=Smaragdicoccus niigatensis TaxID=359359 RepID=UPI000373C483|nr:glycosyltransferase [Smaragdicoccus niigatensis]